MSSICQLAAESGTAELQRDHDRLTLRQPGCVAGDRLRRRPGGHGAVGEIGDRPAQFVTPFAVCTSARTRRSPPGAACCAKKRRDVIVLSTQKNGDVALPPPAMLSDCPSPLPFTKKGSLAGVRLAPERLQPT